MERRKICKLTIIIERFRYRNRCKVHEKKGTQKIIIKILVLTLVTAVETIPIIYP